MYYRVLDNENKQSKNQTEKYYINYYETKKKYYFYNSSNANSIIQHGKCW